MMPIVIICLAGEFEQVSLISSWPRLLVLKLFNLHNYSVFIVFSHTSRRWIVRHAFTKQAEGNVDNRIVDTDEQTQTALDTEMEGSRVAASGYPSNYNAWSHRIWTVKALARCSAEVILHVVSQSSH